MPVKIGVIGVGYLGQHHARIFSGLKDARLVAIADTDKKKAVETAGKYSCRWHTDFRDILNSVDAVSIAAPTTLHYEIAINCLKAGKDVLIEKPIAATVPEAAGLARAAEKGRRILQVGHLERYNPGVVAASGLVKKPLFLEAERVSPFLGRATDVDVTVDLMIHDIDIVMNLVSSPVVDLKAFGYSAVTDKIDLAKAWITFRSGASASITASRISDEKKRILKIFQEDSYIVLDYQTCKVTRFSKGADGLSLQPVVAEKKEPLKEELEDFVRCVKSRERPRVSGKEAGDALKMAIEITEKIKRQKGRSR